MNDNNLRWSLTKSFHYFIHPNGTLPTWCALLRDYGYITVSFIIASRSLDHSSHGGKTLSILLCTEWRQPVDLFLIIGFVGGAKCCLQIYPLQLLQLFQVRTWPQLEHQNPSSHHHRCYQKINDVFDNRINSSKLTTWEEEELMLHQEWWPVSYPIHLKQAYFNKVGKTPKSIKLQRSGGEGTLVLLNCSFPNFCNRESPQFSSIAPSTISSFLCHCWRVNKEPLWPICFVTKNNGFCQW